MPKRVIDFDAMWGSDKLASCAEWAQAEYAWLYGLADASGCFELTNLRVIWGRVAAIRRNLSIERLEQVFGEFQDKGLLFVWEHEGKRYGHWTGSDVPGRLPAPSWRMRLERLAPPVPKQQLAEYVSRYARGRAGLAGGGFLEGGRHGESTQRVEISNLKVGGGGERNFKFEISDLRSSGQRGVEHSDGAEGSGLFERSEVVQRSEVAQRSGAGLRSDANDGWRGTGMRAGLSALKGGVEEHHAQDWDLNLNEGRKEKSVAAGNPAICGESLRRAAIESENLFSNSNLNSKSEAKADSPSHLGSNSDSRTDSTSHLNSKSNSNSQLGLSLDAKTDSKPGSNSGSKTNSDSHCEAQTHSGSNPGIAGAENGNTREPSRTGDCFTREQSGGAERAGDREPGGTRKVWGAAARSGAGFPGRDKSLLVARELLVGRGPVCGPVSVKPEALERIRKRNAAREGSRSP